MTNTATALYSALLCLLSSHLGTSSLLPGLPPSWAQRPGAAGDASFVTNTATALYGAGVELARLRCWRRKLIKHHDSVRPAFYGSMSARSRWEGGAAHKGF